MAFSGLIRSFMVLMVLYGHIIVFYGRSWQNIDLIGLISSFLAVIDPNSFGLVQSKIAPNSNFDSLKSKYNRCIRAKIVPKQA